MKKILTPFILVLASFSADAADIRQTCASPFTVFTISTQAEKVVSHINHPKGIEYSPFYSGNLAIASLNKVLVQADVIKKLGNQQTFSWPKNKCAQTGNIISCTDGEVVEINGVKIHPVILRSMNSVITLPNGVFDVYNLTVAFWVEDGSVNKGEIQVFNLTSNYSLSRDCH